MTYSVEEKSFSQVGPGLPTKEAATEWCEREMERLTVDLTRKAVAAGAKVRAVATKGE